MSNVGVLKTYNRSAIFNNRLSWFIYTPTEKFKNCQENPYFLILYTNFILISYPISSNPTKINTFTYLPSQIPTTNTNHFLPIQIQKTKEKSTFSPIINFSLKITSITSIKQNSHLPPTQKREINNITKKIPSNKKLPSKTRI